MAQLRKYTALTEDPSPVTEKLASYQHKEGTESTHLKMKFGPKLTI